MQRVLGPDGVRIPGVCVWEGSKVTAVLGDSVKLPSRHVSTGFLLFPPSCLKLSASCSPETPGWL